MFSSMPVASAHVRVLAFRQRHRPRHLKLLQNRALGALLVAALAQVDQLRLQRHQAIDARLHVLDMLVDQGVDAAALAVGSVAQVEQAADFVEGHVQRAAVADEGQALDVGLGVEPVVAIAAGRFGQQFFAFVVADGLDRAVGDPRQFSNLHRDSPSGA